jgi:hypothetical protein
VIRAGFSARVHLVNAEHPQIDGVPAVASIAALAEQPLADSRSQRLFRRNARAAAAVSGPLRRIPDDRDVCMVTLEVPLAARRRVDARTGRMALLEQLRRA